MTIEKVPLKASVGNSERAYNENNPQFEIKFEGFVLSENYSVLDTKPSATTSATRTSDVGVYDIIVSGGYDNNYDFFRILQECNLYLMGITLKHKCCEMYAKSSDFKAWYDGIMAMKEDLEEGMNKIIDDEGLDFYYIGKLSPLSYEQLFREIDGRQNPIVNFKFKIDHTVDENLYNYFMDKLDEE